MFAGMPVTLPESAVTLTGIRIELDPGWTEHRRLPAAQRRDADSRVAFFWLTLFWRSKKR